MRSVFGLVLVVGLALAGFAVFKVQDYFAEQGARLAQTTPTVAVLALKETVEFGDPILSDNLAVIQYAEANLPAGIFVRTLVPADGPDTEDEYQFLANGTVAVAPEGTRGARYALRQIEANEPLMLIKLSEPGQETTITNNLTLGMRAFDIPVDLRTGASSFLRPGDRVDVFWSGSIEQGLGRSQEMTQLILSTVRIVAVDQSTDRARIAAAPPRSVTVEVSPQQVGRLAQARQTGSISLALVGDDDNTMVEAIEVNQMSLLGISAPEIVIEEAPEVERRCTIQNINNGQIVLIPIPCTN